MEQFDTAMQYFVMAVGLATIAAGLYMVAVVMLRTLLAHAKGGVYIHNG